MQKSLFRQAALSLVPPTAVLILQIMRVYLLPGHNELDNIAHFFGGFTIAWMFTIIVNALRAHKIIPEPTPQWLTTYTIWGTVCLVGVFWEFWELFMDTQFGFHMQFSIAETLGDLFFDLIGGLVFLAIYWANRSKS